MTEVILNGVLHIFALFAVTLPKAKQKHSRDRVQHYLSDYLGIHDYSVYLGLYDDFISFYSEDGDCPDLARVAEIAHGLAGQLKRLEQYVLVLRFLEISREISRKGSAADIGNILMDAFHLAPDLKKNLSNFCSAQPVLEEMNDAIMLVNFEQVFNSSCHVLNKKEFSRKFMVLFIEDAGAYFLRAGPHSLQIDETSLPAECISLLGMGAIIRDEFRNPIYQFEIASLMSGDVRSSNLSFVGDNLNFRFPGSENGLHNFTFNESGGELIGIMGGSGTGKSTLLSILNGTCEPDSGNLHVNGCNLYEESSCLDGVIGFVPQDDLLFEELTVFENLYYNARLCMAHLSHDELTAEVNKTLKDLKQFETGDLKVGSPLEKTISGGQRKRLNIALELIRKPTILFVDEPTSGLSSADSENVMNLLKAQAASGKLVLVVIHQPSSQIFKMFDKLWILDKGGRPVYTGNPVNAITYFRRAVNLAGMEENICPGCGGVNPEQIFELIEMRVLDEFGHSTDKRRMSAEEWHALHLSEQKKKPVRKDSELSAFSEPEKGLHTPSLSSQLSVFFQRTVRARCANLQYLLITFFEPVFLAFFIAVLCRGFTLDNYIFQENENIGIFFFMSVIVALFLGLSISAEEINRDLKILQRERFLKLSWFSYINSKVGYLALVTGLQMLLYTLTANYVIGLSGFILPMWLSLFACGMTSCILGLNISASFKTAVTIYILIPILLIPQMLLCGVVIEYDQLIPENSGNNLTPWYVEFAPSRWGYEALVIEQYRNNDYMKTIFPHDKVSRRSEYMVDYHLPEMQSLADYFFLRTELPEKEKINNRNLKILSNELKFIEKDIQILSGLPKNLSPSSFNREQLSLLKTFIHKAKKIYNEKRSMALEQKEIIEQGIIKEIGDKKFELLKNNNHNNNITQMVLNELELESVVVSGNRLVPKILPVYRLPTIPWGRSHFYSENKCLGNNYLSTFYFNLIILALMILTGYIFLYFKIFPKLFKSD
jgi:ABC transport system ATP-binding/permease protein